MREYNTALVSKARDSKTSTKSGTSPETDTVIAATAAAKSVKPAAEPAELELERITV